ncbi:unnamed protein product [Paramecium primaurelia]|uniref:Uncharacterized protein n=1 Tax=Paramecium primaurelia TaxID=5886 RepID=A0A8S1K3K9_PARPR|nr:unnamed protein product [Paramecium primaurelia]
MIYLKERSSALIQYVTQDHAAIAKESLNDIMFYGQSIKIFFSDYEVISLKTQLTKPGEFTQDIKTQEEYFQGGEETHRIKPDSTYTLAPPFDNIQISNLTKNSCQVSVLQQYLQDYGQIRQSKLVTNATKYMAILNKFKQISQNKNSYDNLCVINMIQKKIILKLAIKHNPPSLFVIYRYNLKDKKLRRYRIELNSLVYLPTPDLITEQLYIEHDDYLNDNNVEYDQVLKMVQMLYEHQQQKSGTRRSVIKNLDQVDSYMESDQDELNKSIMMEQDDNWQTPPNRRTETIYPKDNTKFNQIHSSESMNLSLSGMQNFMQGQSKKPNNLTYLPINNFDEQINKNRRFVEDQIQQNQQSYFQNKFIELPQPLLNRNNQRVNNYY